MAEERIQIDANPMCLCGPVYTLVAVTVSHEVFQVSSAEKWCG